MRPAWRNKGIAPATMLFFLNGAKECSQGKQVGASRTREPSPARHGLP
jgi:hypothetical protein